MVDIDDIDIDPLLNDQFSAADIGGMGHEERTHPIVLQHCYTLKLNALPLTAGEG